MDLIHLLPINKEGWLPGEEDDDVEEVHPVGPQGVRGNVGGKINMAS